MTADTSHSSTPDLYALPTLSLFLEAYQKLFPDPQSQNSGFVQRTYTQIKVAAVGSHMTVWQVEMI